MCGEEGVADLLSAHLDEEAVADEDCGVEPEAGILT